MINSLNVPQLSSAKPRSGLQSIADLIPRLIRQYEIQAELLQRNTVAPLANPATISSIRNTQAAGQQATFAWYE